VITAEAKAWRVALACRKATELGYPQELWTTRLLAKHARQQGPAMGHEYLSRLAQARCARSSLDRTLRSATTSSDAIQGLMRRWPKSFASIARWRCCAQPPRRPRTPPCLDVKVAIISYDENPGFQAIATTAPDLPPAPGRHRTFLTGKVHASIEDRHRSREFVAFLKQIDAAYPSDTAI